MSCRKKGQAKRPSLTHLVLEQLGDRITPHTYTWTGRSTADGSWMRAANWSSPTGTTWPAGLNDTAVFDTWTPGTRLPYLALQGTTVTLGELNVYGSWSQDIAIDGTTTLEVYDSWLDGTAGARLKGTGTIVFTGSFQNFHSHAHAAMKFDTGMVSYTGSTRASVVDGNQFNSGGGTWIENNAQVFFSGTQKLGSTMHVWKEGEFYVNGNTTLNNNTGGATEATTPLRKLMNHAKVTVALGSLSLNGVAYYAGSGSTTELRASRGLSVGDNTGYADGGTSYDKNIEVFDGTVKMYPFSGLGAENGDVRFWEGAHLDIYAPRKWDADGETYFGSVYIGSDASRTVTFTGTGTQVNFNNYTPAGATNVVQPGAELFVGGDLSVSGTTAFNTRLDLTSQDHDRILSDTGVSTFTFADSPTLSVACSNPPPGETHDYNFNVDVFNAGEGGTISSPDFSPFASVALTGAVGDWYTDSPGGASKSSYTIELYLFAPEP